MTKTESLHILIRSLTKAEKRHIRLQSQLQSGSKIYMSLFDLFEKYDSSEAVFSHFQTLHPDNSFEMALKHTYRIVLESLMKLRASQDIQTEIFNQITKADILFERELFDDALSELNKAKRLAAEFELDLLLQLTRRIELRYLSSMGFVGVSERELVKKQLKINEVMQFSRNINMHTQLHDILKHRLTFKGYARFEKQKEELNDLVLSELHLISNTSVYKGFEARKLHLLFQATFYLNSVILFFSAGKLSLADRHFRVVQRSGKLFYPLPSFKITRLVNLMLQAELENHDFCENEILSIKRNLQHEKQSYTTEKLVFRFVMDYPLPIYEKERMKRWQKYKKLIAVTEQSKHERQLLKTFDFAAWIESKLTKQPFAELLKAKEEGRLMS
ncbi:hypothetical protein LJC35_01440 [Parabacteroides sp. OttesenSCG-928-N08]|nr:hypothetical protein [Parabacteroides sp. OttesenSCG-928-N08]